MNDIVEEARNPDSSAYPSPAHYAARLEGLCQELADEVERLREESVKYRRALWIATDDKRLLSDNIERLRTKLERAHTMWQDARIELKRLQEY